MAPISRRQAVREMATAAAFCGAAPFRVFGRRASFGVDEPQAALDAASLRKLSSAIAGSVITPDGAEYEAARSIFNRAFDRKPAVIVRCAGAPDVARTLEFAQSRHLPLAVRAGGHSRLGYGMCDGGVVIDLTQMKRVEVDAERRVARAGAGVLVHELDEATQRVGLATTSGGCPTVGIAGLTLGGGEGRLMDKYGTACDNLLRAEVVTVDGRVVEASADEDADLFWAIRGGGGNFGVVTRLEYRLHAVGQVYSGGVTYAAGRIGELLQAYSKFAAGTPDEMNTFAQLLPSTQGRRLRVDVCFCGDPRRGDELVGPLRALKPVEDSLRAMPYLEAQAAGGFLLKPVAHFQTNRILGELSEAAIAAIAGAVDQAPETCRLILVPLRGAVTRVRVSEMAFALRQPGYEVDINGVWSNPAEKAAVVRWVETTRDALQPFAHGAYVNQLGDTSEALVRTAYGPNYARLVEMKRKYDSANVLRLNQNIDPDRASKV